ncbi:MAG: type B 50S ribosomal protein L31 [Candidatus Moranbacteria bacterium]|nr:type B 50S ribosomal protein L31 [Candidatus Moranbacteria bacterium]
MKKAIHPNYHDVVFQDASTGSILVTRSTATSKETITVEGKTYPLIIVEVSSQSHPLYTGKRKVMDSTGRVDRFARISKKAADTKAARKSVKSKEEKAKLRREKATKAQKEVKSKKKIVIS